MSYKGFLLIGTAVTPVHPGSGRGLGVVDLTIQRDPLGYPLLFASSIKGALKSMCIRKKVKSIESCIDKSTGVALCGNKNCKDVNECCCLFGSEVGGEESQQALVNVLDFIPLALPVPSVDKGYVYVSTPILLRKSSLIAEALGYEDISKLLHALASSLVGKSRDSGSIESVAVQLVAEKSDRIDIAGSTINVSSINVKEIEKELNKLSEIMRSLGGLVETLIDKLVIVPDEIGPVVIDRAILRVTRIRVRRDRKTAAERSLWTEEYIPTGTVFIGGLLVTPTNNKFCEDYDLGFGNNVDNLVAKTANMLRDILGGSQFYFIVGGKETVGKGLVKTYVYGLGDQKQ